MFNDKKLVALDDIDILPKSLSVVMPSKFVIFESRDKLLPDGVFSNPESAILVILAAVEELNLISPVLGAIVITVFVSKD